MRIKKINLAKHENSLFSKVVQGTESVRDIEIGLGVMQNKISLHQEYSTTRGKTKVYCSYVKCLLFSRCFHTAVEVGKCQCTGQTKVGFYDLNRIV